MHSLRTQEITYMIRILILKVMLVLKDLYNADSIQQSKALLKWVAGFHIVSLTATVLFRLGKKKKLTLIL